MLHQIGAGTLGPIFRAYQPDPGRLVAVKQFRLGFSPESAARFVAALERIVAADLTHTGIAAPIAAGSIDTTPYLALDFVAADSLDVVIREYGPLPIGDVIRFTRQLGRALDVAAGAGVLHGALHPRDLLMTADDVRMTGLGIAAALEEVGMTAPIRRPYSAPERAANAAWDRRADVFSLAALTYEMLFGRPVVGVGADAADGITTLDGADSEALHALFSKALAADPTQRIATASAFVTDLRSILPSPERHASSSGKRKKNEAAPGESLFDAPITAPDPADDLPFEPNLLHAGEYPEGDVLQRGAPADAVDDRDFDINLAAIDIRFDENVRGAEELRLRAEADAKAQRQTLPVSAPAEDERPLQLEPVAAGAYADIDDASADDDVETLGEAPRRPIAIDADVDAPPHAGSGTEGEPEDDAPESLVASSAFSRTESPIADVPLSPPTLAYSTLPGETPASSNWPILLGVVVGLLVGTAFGYFLGTRQHPDSTAAVAGAIAPGGGASGRAELAPATPPAPAPTGAVSGGASASASGSSIAAPPAAAAARPTDAANSSASSAAARSDSRPNENGATGAPAARPAPAVPGGAASAARPQPATRADAAPATRAERQRPAPSARLLVRSTPAGARVTVDGRDAGITPATVTNLSAGAHSVRVTRDGYVAAERRVRIRAAQTAQSLDVTLAPVRPAARPAAAAARAAAPVPAAAADAAGAVRTAGGQGALVVDSRPAGARVFIDGRQVGVTPLQIDGVEAGGHAIRLELEGFGPWATTVQVARGQRARVSGSLER